MCALWHQAANALAQRTKPAGVAFAQAKGMTAGFGPIGAVCYAALSLIL